MATLSNPAWDPVASLHKVTRLRHDAEPPVDGHLSALYSRMIGELLGDLDLLLTGLDPAFERRPGDGRV